MGKQKYREQANVRSVILIVLHGVGLTRLCHGPNKR